MTEICERDRKLTTTNVLLVNLTKIWKFRSYSTRHIRHCGNIYLINNFRSYSTIHVRRCGIIFFSFNFWSDSIVFGHVHQVNFHRCQFFCCDFSWIHRENSDQPIFNPIYQARNQRNQKSLPRPQINAKLKGMGWNFRQNLFLLFSSLKRITSLNLFIF